MPAGWTIGNTNGAGLGLPYTYYNNFAYLSSAGVPTARGGPNATFPIVIGEFGNTFNSSYNSTFNDFSDPLVSCSLAVASDGPGWGSALGVVGSHAPVPLRRATCGYTISPNSPTTWTQSTQLRTHTRPSHLHSGGKPNAHSCSLLCKALGKQELLLLSVLRGSSCWVVTGPQCMWCAHAMLSCQCE